MIVVGIDPGLQVCGYAVIKAELLRTTLLEAGVFRTDSKKRLEQRLCQLAEDMQTVLEKYRPGIVAVSRDLLRSGWQFGKKVYIEDLGVFIIEDTMAPRFSKRIDVAVSDMHHARRIGKRTGKRVILLHQKKDAMTEQASALNKEKTNG